MSISTQVFQVLLKDMRRLRWWTLAVTLWTAAAVSMSLTVAHGPALGFLELFASGDAPSVGTLLFALYAGLLIQEDSPARSDAFWVTRPVRPAALLTAKTISLALFGLLLPLVGQALALRLHGVPVYLGALQRGALSQGVLLTGAALAAALTRDLRSFLLLFLGGAVLYSFLDMLRRVLDPFFIASPASQGIRAFVWIVAAGCAVAYVYSYRRVRSGFGIASLAMLLVVASGWVAGPIARGIVEGDLATDPTPAVDDLDSTEAVDQRLEVTDVAFKPGNGTRRNVWMLTANLQVLGVPGDTDVLLHIRSVRLHWDGGTIARPLRASGSSREVRRLLPSYQQLGEVSRWSASRLVVTLMTLSEQEFEVLRGKTVTLEIDADVERRSWEAFASLPLQVGQRTAFGAKWMELTSVSRSPDNLVMSTRGEWVGTRSTAPFPTGPLSFALVRHDLREYTRQWSRLGGGGVGHGFVLPGVSARAMSPILELELTPDLGVDSEWIEGAELLILEPLTLVRTRRTFVNEGVTLPR